MKDSIRQYLAAIGSKGGQVKSPAKAAASQANGRKGGRPRKAKGRKGSPSSHP
jgi:hypothetical protein